MPEILPTMQINGTLLRHISRKTLNQPKAQIVIGLGYGDEGKGSIVDYLCRLSNEPPVVVRFNGGGQAAHNVVTPEGRHHTFSQVGSGTLAGAATFLSRYMVVSPLALVMELESLDWPEHYVDPRCLVITPYQRALNRLRAEKHGTCGIGFGVAVEWALGGFPSLRMQDLYDPAKTRMIMEDHCRKLLHEGGEFLDPIHWTKQFCATYHKLRVTTPWHLALVAQIKPLIFEGAQGVLLDQDLPERFQPYTTWSKTTFDNAEALLNEIHYPHPIERIGVHRAYAVRHGAGPFPTEIENCFPIDPYNVENEWQGPLRYGQFDPEAFKFALNYCDGVDRLAITCLDHLPLTHTQHKRIIEEAASQRIDIKSYGSTTEDKHENP